MSRDAERDYARLYYDENGQAKAPDMSRFWDESDEFFCAHPGTSAYQKRIAEENVRIFGHPGGPRAIERERAIAAWENEGGK
jgi:hypothetical protein